VEKGWGGGEVCGSDVQVSEAGGLLVIWTRGPQHIRGPYSASPTRYQ
jgi:hypothetical protein